jgi:hypothetical protein
MKPRFLIKGIVAKFDKGVRVWCKTYLPEFHVAPVGQAECVLDQGSVYLIGPVDGVEHARCQLTDYGDALPGFYAAYALGRKGALSPIIKGPAYNVHAPGAVVPLAALPTAEQVAEHARRCR